MNDRPSARELLDAVENFLKQDVIPSVEGRLRYQARVAANVVAIVAREIETEEAQLQAEWQGLGRLLAEPTEAPTDRETLRSELVRANQDLVDRIRAGEADEGGFRREVIAHLEETVHAKLKVALGDPGSG